MGGAPAALLQQARCTVCNGTSEETVFRENGYEGRACRCGTIYMTPEPAPEDVDASLVLHEDTFYDCPPRRRRTGFAGTRAARICWRLAAGPDCSWKRHARVVSA